MRRYKIDICTCDNHAPINHLKYIPTDDGPWVLYEDHATRITDLEAQLAAAQERNVALQSEHLDHVSALHKRIKELEKKNDHK